MAKPILPEALLENIKDLFGKGYTQDAVFRFAKGPAQKYVESEKQLNRCPVQIRNKVPVIPKKQVAYPSPPDRKTFTTDPYSKILSSINKRTPTRKIEKAGRTVAKDLLKKHEGFRQVRNGPEYAGTPVDLFGFKDRTIIYLVLFSYFV